MLKQRKMAIGALAIGAACRLRVRTLPRRRLRVVRRLLLGTPRPTTEAGIDLASTEENAIRALLAAALEPLPASCFRMAATNDGRGNGLFAAQTLERGFIMEYLGEILDQHAFDLRYPTDGRCSESEHAVGILCTDGSHAFVDAVRPERSTLARYMNHAGDTPNCVLWTLNEPGCCLPSVRLQKGRSSCGTMESRSGTDAKV